VTIPIRTHSSNGCSITSNTARARVRHARSPARCWTNGGSRTAWNPLRPGLSKGHRARMPRPVGCHQPMKKGVKPGQRAVRGELIGRGASVRWTTSRLRNWKAISWVARRRDGPISSSLWPIPNAHTQHMNTATLPNGRLTLRASDFDRNFLLAALPDEERSRWLSHLELVTLRLGDVLHESSTSAQFAYFPTDAIVSLHYVLEDGTTSQFAVVGRGGVVGIATFMGGGTTTGRAEVHGAGQAVRVPAHFMKEAFNRTQAVHDLMLRYTQSLIAQASQAAVCNRHHSVRQQMCRWLLLNLDCVDGNVLCTTHERIANLLGVRREGVTEAALRMRRAGTIDYRRGGITVRDRSALEQCACECYSVVKKEYDRLLPRPGRPVDLHLVAAPAAAQKAVGHAR